MSDNQDLKSKILLMRQKNLGEVINESNEKNDNEKPKNAETSLPVIVKLPKSTTLPFNSTTLNVLILDSSFCLLPTYF